MQAAQSVQTLAEGQEVRLQKGGRSSPWMIVIYIFAALFGLELLIMLTSLFLNF